MGRLRFSVGGVAMALVHATLLALALMLTLAHQHARWAAYWTPFLALDFPLSLGVLPLAWMFPTSSAGPLSDFPNFWWPLAFHGLVGTWWWYIIGASMQARFVRWRAHRGDRGAVRQDDDLGDG